jgi:HEAT repeats
VTARDVSEAIKARARQLAPTATHFTWIGRRNQASLMLSPVDDIQDFANRIDFGTVTVRGNQLNVTVSPDFIASVPRLPAEQSQTPDINPSPRAANRDPEIPADADAVTRSLIQLKADASHTKKDGLNRLMRTQPDERLAEVVQAILPLLEDDDGFLVSDAVKTLVIWKSPEAVPALAKLTNDNRFNVRHEAIKALGKIKDPRGVEPVVQRIKEDGFQAEDALKEMGSIAEAALIERLTNPDSGVRRRVCEILKEIGGKQALLAMAALPADPDLGVRMAAKDAMSSITLRVGPLTPAERKKSTGGSSSRSGSRR